MSDFTATIAGAYATDLPALDLGRAVHEGAVVAQAPVKLPLRMVNRHGLIAGATGTGKTKTLQGLVEQLSAAGVPSVVADVKGDLSGLRDPGAADGPAPARQAELGLPFAPTGYPVELFSIGGIGPGVPIRATLSDFGPQLLGKILEANEVQEQSLQLVFHYADTKGLPLLDLSDLRALLTFLDSDDGKPELAGIGGLSAATVGVLLRAMVGLEIGGGTEFFGEPQLDISDLLRVAPDGRGIVSCLELPAVQDKPALFSTTLMWMLAELFETLPEVGDLDKPKLVFFFDEAHLLFKGATPAFIDSVVQTVRLIRSKGVGIFFITQTPKDVPGEILGQLGNRIQHALRVFTPDDEKALSSTVKTYPKSEFYDVAELLTSVGTGEAAVTILSAKGTPTPVVHTRLPAPASRMAPTDDVAAAAAASPLMAKYGTRVDSQSAREMLSARLEESARLQAAEAEQKAQARREKVDGAAAAPAAAEAAAPAPAAPKPAAAAKHDHKKAAEVAGGGAGAVGAFLKSPQGRALIRDVGRGVFGMLKKK
ncbi:MAG: helicase HerA-like domain-containing protein [Solirubrobacteraceae bacterium]